MWKTLSDWLFALFNMSRELQEHRETIRQLEDRVSMSANRAQVPQA